MTSLPPRDRIRFWALTSVLRPVESMKFVFVRSMTMLVQPSSTACESAALRSAAVYRSTSPVTATMWRCGSSASSVTAKRAGMSSAALWTARGRVHSNPPQMGALNVLQSGGVRPALGPGCEFVHADCEPCGSQTVENSGGRCSGPWEGRPMLHEHAFQYVECDVPQGMTLDHWR